MIQSFRTDMPGQTLQTQIRLLVCHSVCIVWTHYSKAEPHSSNFKVITTNFWGVWIFRKFMVQVNNWARAQQKQQNDLWAQLRLTSAWPSIQSDQSLLCKDPKILYADSKDFDQTTWVRRLICVFCWKHMSFCWFCCAPLLLVSLPLLVISAWSSVLSGLLFSQAMYFFHRST